MTGFSGGVRMIAAGLMVAGAKALSLARAFRRAPTAAPESRLRLSPPWALLTPLLLGATALAAIAAVAFHIESASLKADQLAQLNAVARLKAADITRWLAGHRAIAGAASRNPATVALLARWLDRGDGADRAQLLHYLEGGRTMFGYRAVELWSRDGRVLLPTGRTPSATDPVAAAAREAMATGRTVMVDLFRSPDDSLIHLGHVVPLVEGGVAGGAVLGALYFDVDPTEFLFPHLREWPLPSRTGETLLVRREGGAALFLNDPRFRPGAALSLAPPLTTPNLPAALSLLNSGAATVSGVDYRGAPVLAATTPIADTPWSLVAKVDRAEALAGITRLALFTGGLTAATLAVVAMLAAFLWQRQLLRAALDAVSQRRAVTSAGHRAWRVALEAVAAPPLRPGSTSPWRVIGCYALAAALTGATLLVRLRFDAAFGHPMQDLFLIVIMISAYCGGLGPGLLATALTIVCVRYALIPANYDTMSEDSFLLTQSMVVILAGSLLSVAIEALHRSRRRAESSRLLQWVTLACIGDGIITAGPDDRVTFLNAEAERLTGWNSWEATGMPLSEVLALAAGDVMRTRDGREIPVEVRGAPIRIADGTVLGAVHVVRDRTVSKRAEAELRESEARFSAMVHASPIGIGLGKCSDGRLRDVNEAWLKLYGYTLEEVIGRTTLDLNLYAEPELREGVIERARLPGKVQNIEMRFRRKTGDLIDALYSADIIDLGGEPHLLVMVSDITAQKRARAAIENSHRQMRLFIEQAPLAIAMFDRDGLRIATSRRWVEDWGTGGADGTGTELPEIWRVAHREALAGLTVRKDEDLWPRAEGAPVWLRWVALPWTNELGAIGGVIISAEDITERKAIELDMRRYAEIIEHLAAPLIFFDQNLRYTLVNPAYAALYGATPDRIQGRHVSEVTGPAVFAEIAPHLERALAGNYEHYSPVERVFPDGRRHALHVRYTPFVVGGVVQGVVVDVHDVTELRDAQTALEAHQARLEDMVAARTAELAAAEEQARLILESSADGLYGLDPDGRIVFINPAACRMLGWRADDLVGRSMHTLAHHTRADGTRYPEADCPTLSTLRSGKATRVDDDVYWRADGHAFPVSFASHPMLRDGHIVGAVVSFTDITARVAANAAREQALREAERLARVRREFLANMSHEIRTPLNAVLTLAQLGRRENTGATVHDDKSRATFSRILEAGRGLRGIIDEILDFSKIEAGKLRLEPMPIAPGEVIDRAVHLVAARAYAKGLRMSVGEAVDLPVAVMADALRLTQVLGNLLSNAVKFTPPGGSVSLEAGLDGGRLSFRVSDSGIGMSPEQRARLFQPFEQADGSTTRHFGGTGLGLAISRSLVELMGGEIHVGGALGVGSVFEVRLPLEEATVTPGPSLTGPIVLVGLADAEAAGLAEALRSRGVEAVTAAVGDGVGGTPAGLLVTSEEALAQGVVRPGIDAWLARGGRVALIVTPGQERVFLQGRDTLMVVERPLRARHILAAVVAPPGRRLEPVDAGPRLTGWSVLIADDNEVNRLTLEELLTLEGAAVTSVGNGLEAVACVREHDGGAYHIVLTDIQMPEMDGYQAAREIHALAPNLPIIGVTAHAMLEERTRCFDAGMVGHVAKPIDTDGLVSVMLGCIRVTPQVAAAPLAMPRPAPAPAESRPTAPDAAPIDWERLNGRYRAAFVETLVATASESLSASVSAVQAAARERDMARLAALAHSLKGTAGNLLAAPLADLSVRTERAARAGDDEAATALAGQLAKVIEALLAALNGRLHPPADPAGTTAEF